MTDWKARVENEREELGERLSKLRSFLSDEKKALEIAGASQVELMHEQRGLMENLLQVLSRRLELAELEPHQ